MNKYVVTMNNDIDILVLFGETFDQAWNDRGVECSHFKREDIENIQVHEVPMEEDIGEDLF